MKKLNFFLLLFFALKLNISLSQYNDLNIKEQFDKMQPVMNQNNRYYANYETENYGIVISPDQLGDGMANILSSYLYMYRTTKDKAYLIKFINE